MFPTGSALCTRAGVADFCPVCWTGGFLFFLSSLIFVFSLLQHLRYDWD